MAATDEMSRFTNHFFGFRAEPNRFTDYLETFPMFGFAQSSQVLLHGIPTWGYLWRDLCLALSSQHRTLVPDLAGFGFSDKRDCFDRSIARHFVMFDQPEEVAEHLRDFLTVP